MQAQGKRSKIEMATIQKHSGPISRAFALRMHQCIISTELLVSTRAVLPTGNPGLNTTCSELGLIIPDAWTCTGSHRGEFPYPGRPRKSWGL